VKIFVILVNFRSEIFAKNENIFSRKCENENFRFNPNYGTSVAGGKSARVWKKIQQHKLKQYNKIVFDYILCYELPEPV
jgi:hypothetical protein